MRAFVVGSMVFCAVAIALAVQTEPKIVDAVNGKIITDTGTTEIAGVCTVTESKIGCWNYQGHPDEDLSERFRAYQLTQDATIPFRYHAKNRYVVVRYSHNDRNRGYEAGSWTAEDQPYLQQCGQMNRNGESSYVWYHIPAERGKTTVTLFNTLTRYSRNIPDLELKVGASVKVEDATVKIAMIGALSADRPAALQNPFYAVNKWKVELDIPSSLDGAGISCWILDAKKKPITYLDKNGNPTDPPASQIGGLPGNNVNPQKLVVSISTTRSPGKAEILLPINPEKVGFINFNVQHSSKFAFRNIPIEPKTQQLSSP